MSLKLSSKEIRKLLLVAAVLLVVQFVLATINLFIEVQYSQYESMVYQLGFIIFGLLPLLTFMFAGYWVTHKGMVPSIAVGVLYTLIHLLVALLFAVFFFFVAQARGIDRNYLTLIRPVMIRFPVNLLTSSALTGIGGGIYLLVDKHRAKKR